MTLEKAIENRRVYLKNRKIPKSSDDYNATCLGIEALKHYIQWRIYTYHAKPPILPGETK